MRARPSSGLGLRPRALLAASMLVALIGMPVPHAAAAVPFTLAWEDPAGDNPAPSADVVGFASTVEGGVVTQRVSMAGAPDAVQDTLILRNWFHDSTNGSFHVLDLEIHAWEEDDAKFRALVRRGSFENVTAIDATYAVDGNAWVFTFAEELVADASCFDPIVWSQHEPENGSWSTDQGGIGTRYCRVRGDPTPAPTGPPPTDRPGPGFVRVPPAATSSQAGDGTLPVSAPGSSNPDLSPWLLVAVGLGVLLLTFRVSWKR